MTEYFTITRTLSAPRDLVFDVLTLPEHFAVWFGTAVVDVPQESLQMQVWPGGEFRAVMHLPEGGVINWSGAYLAVDAPAHFAMTLSDQPDRDAGPPVLFDLDEAGQTTTLTIRQDRSHFTTEQVSATAAGYNAFVDDIDEILQSLQS
ncbi:SRPBCC family protein (plasmid) [Coraliomargarita sp. W4R53]